jgi:hypothetical protein
MLTCCNGAREWLLHLCPLLYMHVCLPLLAVSVCMRAYACLLLGRLARAFLRVQSFPLQLQVVCPVTRKLLTVNKFAPRLTFVGGQCLYLADFDRIAEIVQSKRTLALRTRPSRSSSRAASKFACMHACMPEAGMHACMRDCTCTLRRDACFWLRGSPRSAVAIASVLNLKLSLFAVLRAPHPHKTQKGVFMALTQPIVAGENVAETHSRPVAPPSSSSPSSSCSSSSSSSSSSSFSGHAYGFSSFVPRRDVCAAGGGADGGADGGAEGGAGGGGVGSGLGATWRQRQQHHHHQPKQQQQQQQHEAAAAAAAAAAPALAPALARGGLGATAVGRSSSSGSSVNAPPPPSNSVPADAPASTASPSPSASLARPVEASTPSATAAATTTTTTTTTTGAPALSPELTAGGIGSEFALEGAPAAVGREHSGGDREGTAGASVAAPMDTGSGGGGGGSSGGEGGVNAYVGGVEGAEPGFLRVGSQETAPVAVSSSRSPAAAMSGASAAGPSDALPRPPVPAHAAE